MRYSNNLASVFLELEEKSKSYYYAKKSYQLAFDTSDSLGMASSLVNLALSEVLNERFDDALKHLDQVLALGYALDDDSYVLDALINKADVHSQLKNFREALSLYERSAQVLKKYPVPDYELYVYWGLAQNYFHTGRFNAAKEYLEKAVTVARDLQSLQELSKLYLLGSEIHEQMNENSIALSFRKQYEVLNDSIVGIETRRNIHQMEIEYQTAQKEKAIADQQLIIARNNLEIERKDKSILLWSALAILLFSAIAIFVLMYRNKQRANAEKIALLKKQGELDVLNALMEGEEKERLRLARELHDGVGGILSASKMHLSILQEDSRNGSASGPLKNIASMLDHASQEIRNIAHNLFPDILIMNDLDVAVASFCERVKSADLNVGYYCLGEMPKLNNRFKLMVYRAIQELINNVIKHARASNVLVQLSCHDNILTVVVEDDGSGFSGNGKEGMGLTNLREKVRSLDGEISIESRPGHGTTVQLEFKVSPIIEHSVTVPSIIES
jgi:signal transduction histidine kinase